MVRIVYYQQQILKEKVLYLLQLPFGQFEGRLEGITAYPADTLLETSTEGHTSADRKLNPKEKS